MPHTFHVHENESAHSASEDFDSHQRITASNPAPLQGSTISLTLSPRKLFFIGFLFGVLVMAIPTVIFATKFFSGGGLKISVIAPGAPSAAEPQPAPEAVKPVSGDDHIWGNKDAKITIVEYSDMECPFCKQFHPSVARVIDEYNGKVNWVYRHFPLSQLHQNAQKEAEATECAAQLDGNDGFWKYLNTVMERTESNDGFSLDKLVPLAKELGLDEKKFKDCLDSGKYTEKVQKDFSDGQAAGIQGTPGGFILAKNGKSAVIEGAIPYDQLKWYVDQFLK